jgi:pimeloyl-ACP methyl ester carboxylesterase
VASFLAQRTNGPVVLVGHSYGGFVITNAALAGGDVKALVYVDAFMPDEGETTFVVLGDSGSALAVPDPTTVLDVVGYPGAPEGDADAYLKPDVVHTAFAPDLPEADRWLIAASQRPLTLAANTIPSGVPAWKTLPSWAVIGTEDRIIPPAAQRRMAGRAGATITEVDSSHVSMVSHPDVSVAAILDAVAAVG